MKLITLQVLFYDEVAKFINYTVERLKTEITKDD